MLKNASKLLKEKRKKSTIVKLSKTSSLAPNFKFIKKDKIDYDTILDGIYAPDSDLLFEELEFCKIHSNYGI